MPTSSTLATVSFQSPGKGQRRPMAAGAGQCGGWHRLRPLGGSNSDGGGLQMR
jgi:hypothetical protein